MKKKRKVNNTNKSTMATIVWAMVCRDSPKELGVTQRRPACSNALEGSVCRSTVRVPLLMLPVSHAGFVWKKLNQKFTQRMETIYGINPTLLLNFLKQRENGSIYCFLSFLSLQKLNSYFLSFFSLKMLNSCILSLFKF